MGRPKKEQNPKNFKDIGVGFEFTYDQLKTKYFSDYHEVLIIVNSLDCTIQHNFKTSYDYKYSLNFKLKNNRQLDFESILKFDFENAEIWLNLVSKSNTKQKIDNVKSANELTGLIFKIIREFSDKYTKISSFSTYDYVHQTKQDILKYIFEYKFKDKYVKSYEKHGFFYPYNEIIYSKI